MKNKILKLLMFKPNDNLSKVISAFNKTAIYTDGKGFGVVINDQKKCIGVLTDGDIRRGLNKYDKNHPIKNIYNKNFSYTEKFFSNTANLQIFEKLINSNNYHMCLPVLDKDKRLIDIINYQSFLNKEKKIKCVRVKIPARVSFVGGGADFSEYLTKSRSYILSSTIQKYLTVSLYPRIDNKISISNYTNGNFFEFKNYDELKKFKKNNLIINILKNKILNFGFKLEIISDFKPKTGLGGSSILSIGIIKALNLLQNIHEEDKSELINQAYKSERLDSKIKGGWQDYLSSTFGGLNWIDMYQSDFYVHQINLEKKTLLELENNLVLINIGSRTTSESIQKQRIEKYKKNPEQKIKQFEKMRNLSIDMKNCLIKGELENFGKLMDRSWYLKKIINPMATNKKIDKIYDITKEAGAIGGKVLGAGQNGYLLLYIESFNQSLLQTKLKKINLHNKIETLNFSSEGIKYWKVF
jgi:D-glycero-alpha-D-manno-heptose-7-phosphate kinase